MRNIEKKEKKKKRQINENEFCLGNEFCELMMKKEKMFERCFDENIFSIDDEFLRKKNSIEKKDIDQAKEKRRETKREICCFSSLTRGE